MRSPRFASPSLPSRPSAASRDSRVESSLLLSRRLCRAMAAGHDVCYSLHEFQVCPSALRPDAGVSSATADPSAFPSFGQAENPDELSFGALERIVILERDDQYGDGWFQVGPVSDSSGHAQRVRLHSADARSVMRRDGTSRVKSGCSHSHTRRPSSRLSRRRRRPRGSDHRRSRTLPSPSWRRT